MMSSLHHIAAYLTPYATPSALAAFLLSWYALAVCGSREARRILLPIIGAGCAAVIIFTKG